MHTPKSVPLALLAAMPLVMAVVPFVAHTVMVAPPLVFATVACGNSRLRQQTAPARESPR